MSTSLLFHSFGIRGYQLKRYEFSKGNVYIHIKQDKHNLRCAHCKSSKVIRRGTRTRTFRSVPIGLKATFIVLNSQRVFCNDCQRYGYVQISFADTMKRYTRSFRQYALALLRHSTVLDVAKHLGVSWDIVKEIDQSDLRKNQNPPLKDVSRIAIDEISFGSRHKYLTIVLDIESGQVIFIGDGKGADSLDPFWKRLKRSKAMIEAVATDMSRAYISAVETHLPNAAHVADPFHIVKLFNDKLSDLRREIYNNLDDDEKKTS